MSSSSEWGPEETSEEIFSEHTWLQGAFLGAVAFGMHSVLYFMSVHLLHNHPSGRRSRNRPSPNSSHSYAWNNKRYGLILYITVMYVLSILYMVGLLQFTQQSFIDDRNYPGGPNAYEEEMFSVPIDMLANVIMVLLTWMCDIINVWRCTVIYKGSRVPVWVATCIPILLYLASVATGILFLKQVGAPASSPWASSGINWTIPYYTMSLSLNILVTLLIVGRLLLYRARISSVLGYSHGAQYASLVAMIVESAAIYSGWALAFLVPFALSSPVAQLFLQPLSMVQVLSTFLIIFRVAQGKGWSHEQATMAMTGTIGGSQPSGPIQIRAMKSTVTDSSGTRTCESRIPAGEGITLDSMKPSQIEEGDAGSEEHDPQTKTIREGW